jgi:hypothetical protein
MLSIDWLFLSHWRKDSIVSVLGVWSVLVELDLGMSHVVLILVHRASKIGLQEDFLIPEQSESKCCC